RHAADFCEFIERGAAVADDAIAAFDEIIRNRQADFADADETNGVHGRSQFVILHYYIFPLVVVEG
ncbi:MAG TPA: hypothetical protein VFO15_05380, partial [Xanthobacteraceae bacterium]|nr:hypothetical protein [Xanthobacteraceae bacterium]